MQILLVILWVLSRQAAKVDQKTILFCGVNFMAETAAIISPQKKVLTS